jgi:hypothetical protein
MPKSTRSVAIELAENSDAISSWRDGLTERQRSKWRHPLTLTRHWRASQPPSDPPDRLVSIETTRSIATFKHDAMAAWRRFVALCEALPPNEAAGMWREAQAQAALSLGLPPDTKVFGPKFGPIHNETGRNETSLDSTIDPR